MKATVSLESALMKGQIPEPRGKLNVRDYLLSRLLDRTPIPSSGDVQPFIQTVCFGAGLNSSKSSTQRSTDYPC